MEPYYKDNHIRIFNKDCRSMDELPDNSVQCVVTSPPYWGLRKYAGEQDLIWGGDKDCEHEWGKEKTIKRGHPGDKTTLVGTQTADLSKSVNTQGSFCSFCGAWKGAYGLEPTPEMYIQHTIQILREIRRVLRKDGVVFWDIGDSYYGSGGDHKEGGKNDAGFQGDLMRGVQAKQQKHNLLKPKDLCLIPFRVAIAAQEDGWWVRSVIIWSKPNPMPESVTDRPTESHEYILMLTKSARYYWDADAVREPHHYPPHSPGNRGGFESRVNGQRGEWGEFKEPDRIWATEGGRNIRTVWEFPTQPYPEAHFAVFPEKLPEICIKAATPEIGCCSKCGAPWERIIKLNRPEGAGKPDEELTGRAAEYRKMAIALGRSPKSGSGFDRSLSTIMKEALNTTRETIGWLPTCKCNADKVPSLVLDPFLGAGTTLQEAKNLNRYAAGYELAEEYCQLAIERNRQQVLV